MINYLKTVFTKPKEIYTARNMKNSHYFLFILITSFILTFLSLFEIIPVAHQFLDDYEEIYSSIPDFELVNGKLESETGSYIYQTNSIMFYFDSEDRITTDEIESNRPMQSAPITIGILKEQIYISAMDTSYSFVYNNFEALTSKDLIDFMDNIGNFSISTYLLLIIILLVLNLFIFLTQLIPITLFANLISLFRRTRMTFIQNAKIALLSSIIPFILIATLNAFQFQIYFQFEIILFSSLLLFYMSITELKKRLPTEKN